MIGEGKEDGKRQSECGAAKHPSVGINIGTHCRENPTGR